MQTMTYIIVWIDCYEPEWNSFLHWFGNNSHVNKINNARRPNWYSVNLLVRETGVMCVRKEDVAITLWIDCNDGQLATTSLSGSCYTFYCTISSPRNDSCNISWFFFPLLLCFRFLFLFFLSVFFSLFFFSFSLDQNLRRYCHSEKTTRYLFVSRGVMFTGPWVAIRDTHRYKRCLISITKYLWQTLSLHENIFDDINLKLN